MKPLLIVLFAFWVLSSTFRVSAQGWEWQNPLPQGNSLHAGQVIDANKIVCVGDDATFLKSTDSGLSWSVSHNTGGTDNSFRGVCFVDENVGVVVGEQGTIIRTEDGGTTWRVLPSPTSDWLYDVWFSDANNGTVVGDFGSIMQTSDGGETWVTRISGVTRTLNGISFTDVDTGAAVGKGGTILRTVDGGLSWSLQTSGITSDLNDVCFTNSNTGTAVGDNGVVLRTTNGGSTWIAQNSGTTLPLYGVSLVDESFGFAVGLPKGLLRTTNGGTTWTTLNLTDQQLGCFDVFFHPTNIGLCVGSGGLIFQSTNAGVNWLELSFGSRRTSMVDICFATSEFGIGVGEFGEDPSDNMLRTTDGGKTWHQHKVFPGDLYSVWITDEQHSSVTRYLSAGGAIHTTTNQGESWTSVVTRYLMGAIHYHDSLNGIAVGDHGIVLRTVDGGFTWQELQSGEPFLNGVWMVDENTAIAVGGGGMFGTKSVLLRTSDGGTSWQTISTPAEAPLFGVTFVGSSIGVAVGSSGEIIRTTDGGVSWTSQLSNTTNTLKHVRFNRDGSVGYSVGGVALRTTDTGITWAYEETPGDALSVTPTGDSGWTIGGNDGAIFHKNEFLTSIPPVTVDADIDPLHQFVPAEGDTFAYTLTIENHTSTTQTIDWWTKVLRPRGNPFDPLAGPGTVSLNPFETVVIDTLLLQVPSNSWTGDYSLVGFVGTYAADTVDSDTAAFYKLPAIPCEDIAQFQARCRPGGIMQARIVLTDMTHTGDVAEFTIDDLPYEATVAPNGRASVSLTGFNPGSHDVELTEPPGCYLLVVVTCPAGLAKDDGDFWHDDESWAIPTATALFANYPNPFNPTTAISYQLSADSWVSLKVYTMLGQVVKTLVDEPQVTGYKEVVWNGKNDSGVGVASGIYIYRLIAGKFAETKRMLLVK